MNLKYLHIFLFPLLLTAASALGAEPSLEAEVPWAQIPAQKAAVVRQVLNSYTLHRQLEESLPACPPATFEFMLDRLRITNIVARQVSPRLEHALVTKLGEDRYFIDDQIRTTGTVELLYKTPSFRLYLAQGKWRYWGEHYFSGNIVIFLFYQPLPQTPPSPLKTTIQVYIKLESPVVSALTRAVDVIIPILVDRRVALMSFTIRAASEKMCRDPQYVYELLLQEPDITEAEKNEYKTIFLSNMERRTPWDKELSSGLVSTP
jgi:hypothetical protein